MSSKQDAHCMKCHKAWPPRVVCSQLNRSFFQGDYRKHREALLVDMEMSRLPETMQMATDERQAREIEAAMGPLHKERADLNEQVRLLNIKVYREERRIMVLRGIIKEKDVEKKVYQTNCQAEDCRGFLDDRGTCGICGVHTCINCLDLLGGEDEDRENHVCNEGTLATAQEIKRTSRGCPKCGLRISKVSGCDQMWCTGCQTAFSWKTGAIQMGVIHNPHFFEYQRTAATQPADGANRAFGQCNAQDMPAWYLVRTALGSLVGKEFEGFDLRNAMMAGYRMLAHINRAEIPHSRTKIDELGDASKLRVSYLLKEITQEEVGKRVYADDRSRRRLGQMLQVLELLETVGREQIWGWINDPNQERTPEEAARDALRSIQRLALYCNEQWMGLSQFHKVQMPFIEIRIAPTTGTATREWIVFSKKKY